MGMLFLLHVVVHHPYYMMYVFLKFHYLWFKKICFFCWIVRYILLFLLLLIYSREILS